MLRTLLGLTHATGSPVTENTPKVGSDAPDDVSLLGPAEQPSGACPQPGCRVPREMVRFKGADGRLRCISHADDQTPKQRATTKGGDAKRRKERKAVVEKEGA